MLTCCEPERPELLSWFIAHSTWQHVTNRCAFQPLTDVTSTQQYKIAYLQQFLTC